MFQWFKFFKKMIGGTWKRSLPSALLPLSALAHLRSGPTWHWELGSTSYSSLEIIFSARYSKLAIDLPSSLPVLLSETPVEACWPTPTYLEGSPSPFSTSLLCPACLFTLSTSCHRMAYLNPVLAIDATMNSSSLWIPVCVPRVLGVALALDPVQSVGTIASSPL